MFRSLLRPVGVLSRTTVGSTSFGVAPALVAASPSPAVFLETRRGVVIDRATKQVSLKRRMRRDLLRKIALNEAGGIIASKRLSDDSPPLAPFEKAAANLHQFVTFLARQSKVKGEEEKTKVIESTKIVRHVAAPAWELTFEQLRILMSGEKNRKFRACEEILGALSDPTTDLGQRGLTPEELNFTLDYVRDTMERTLRHLRFGGAGQSPMKEAGYLVSSLSVEDQSLYSGSLSIQFLIAQLKQDTKAQAEILLAARSQNVIAPFRTALSEAMKHDIYPAQSPEALLASTQPKAKVIDATTA